MAQKWVQCTNQSRSISQHAPNDTVLGEQPQVPSDVPNVIPSTVDESLICSLNRNPYNGCLHSLTGSSPPLPPPSKGALLTAYMTHGQNDRATAKDMARGECFVSCPSSLTNQPFGPFCRHCPNEGVFFWGTPKIVVVL